MAVASCGIALSATGTGEPTRHLDALCQAAASCERAGIEALLIDGRPRNGAAHEVLEPFTILGALAAATSSVSLGAVLAADERAPSVLAKATSTLDVCSHGRALLVLSPPAGAVAGEGGGLLGECVAVVQAMLTFPSPTLKGRHVAVHGAWNEPRGFSAPPPVAVALPVEAPGRTGDLVAEWRALPAFVLAEGPSAAGPPPASGADRGPGVPVLRLVRGMPACGLRRGGFDGLVVRFDEPVEATPDALGRVAEAASKAG